MSNYVENGVASAAFVCTPEKKNIFLIGDSIRRGYCKTVRSILEDHANVFFVEDNCRSTQYVICNIKHWAALFSDPALVDLVHFNCGQWDVAHWSGHPLPLTSESEYAKNLQIIIDLLHQYFPSATLVFATTSRMNPENAGGVNPRSNEEVDRYNEIAKAVMAANGIAVSDLNAFMKDFGSELFTDLCHLTPEGFAKLGEFVAEKIETYPIGREI